MAADDASAQANFHYCRAIALETLGHDGDDVLQVYESGLAAARASEDLRLVADGLSLLGSTRSLLGDQASAIPDLLAAIRLYRQSGHRLDAEYLLLDIGISYRRMGEFAKAREYLDQSAAFAERQDDWAMLIGTLMQQAYLAEDDGRPAEAMAIYRRVLALAEEHDSAYDIAGVHLAMAWPAILQGEHRQALAYLDQAQEGFAALEDRSSADMLALRRGQAHAGLGRHSTALAHYARAAGELERTGNQRYLAMLYLARAESLEALGQMGAAYADLERYIDVNGRIAAAERSQQAQLLRKQFDSDRRDLENTRLANETALRERTFGQVAHHQTACPFRIETDHPVAPTFFVFELRRDHRKAQRFGVDRFEILVRRQIDEHRWFSGSGHCGERALQVFRHRRTPKRVEILPFRILQTAAHLQTVGLNAVQRPQQPVEP